MLTIKTLIFKRLLMTDLYVLRGERIAEGHTVLSFPKGSDAWWETVSPTPLTWTEDGASAYASLQMQVGSTTPHTLNLYHKRSGTRAGETRLQNMRQAPPQAWRDALAGRRPDPGRCLVVILRASDDQIYGRLITDSQALPAAIKDRLARQAGNAGCIDLSEEGGAVIADPIVARILEALRTRNNAILVGPPGTGKTYLMNAVDNVFRNGVASVFFDPLDMEAPFKAQSYVPFAPERTERKSFFVTFHQSYGYESFISGLRPVRAKGGGLDYQVTVGPLLQAAEITYNGGASLVLIDEINRGNTAEIFGELITLLEADKRLGPNNERTHPGHTPIAAVLPYAPSGLKVVDQDTGELRLPKHLYVLASMNSVDRSVAPLDAALRRRFAVLDVVPDLDLLRQRTTTIGDKLPDEATKAEWQELANLACALLESLNHRIGVLRGSEFMLGHAYLWEVFMDDDAPVSTRQERLIRAVSEKIIPQLREMFRDDVECTRFVLPAEKQLYKIHDASMADASGLAAVGYVSWTLPDSGNRIRWIEILNMLSSRPNPSALDSLESSSDSDNDGDL